MNQVGVRVTLFKEPCGAQQVTCKARAAYRVSYAQWTWPLCREHAAQLWPASFGALEFSFADDAYSAFQAHRAECPEYREHRMCPRAVALWRMYAVLLGERPRG